MEAIACVGRSERVRACVQGGERNGCRALTERCARQCRSTAGDLDGALRCPWAACDRESALRSAVDSVGSGRCQRRCARAQSAGRIESPVRKEDLHSVTGRVGNDRPAERRDRRSRGLILGGRDGDCAVRRSTLAAASGDRCDCAIRCDPAQTVIVLVCDEQIASCIDRETRGPAKLCC